MAMAENVRAREALNKLKPYSPGKPIWEVQRELGLQSVVKLASNENALGPSPMAIEAIHAALPDLHRYPDAQTLDLRSKLAEKLQLAVEEVIVTNGGDELITLICEAFLEPGDEIVIPEPSFSEYEFGGSLMDAVVKKVPLQEHYQYAEEDIIDAVTERTKILFLCSPNNPTGTILTRMQLQRILNHIPKRVLVVLDTAYSHYAAYGEYTDGVEFVKAGYSVAVLGTFSKVYGLAGVRVGFGIAPKEVVRWISQVKEPFNVNALAQAAAAAALEDEEHVRTSVELVKLERERFYAAFRALGLPFTESMSNFILVELGEDASGIARRLLEQGVIVRFGGTWGLHEHVRISIGTPEENDILIKKLGQMLHETSS